MSNLTKLFRFVITTAAKYKIDESHGLIHSMNTLHYTHEIFSNEAIRYPFMREQEKVAYIAAVIHDMCDKKYMDQEKGIREIRSFFKDDVTQDEMDMVATILGTMSYSTVKKNGFPELNTWQRTYHCVREADLLGAYDFDRCIIFNLANNDTTIEGAFHNAMELFESRMFRHRKDGLFQLRYSRCKSMLLEKQAHIRIRHWRDLIQKTTTPLI